MRLETVRESARSCGISVNTTFRWRHRFLSTQTRQKKLEGILEVDETLFLHSRKGDRKAKQDRPPQSRGGTASQRGRSSEQVAVLTTVQRGGPTRTTKLSGMKSEPLKLLLAEQVAADSVLVSDGYVRGSWHP